MRLHLYDFNESGPDQRPRLKKTIQAVYLLTGSSSE